MLTPEQALERITQFHGHGGPWAALGYKAGETARMILSPEKIKDLKVHARLKYDIPYSCFLDGLQVGSCCTIGKKNLTFSDGDVPVSEFTMNGVGFILEIRPDVIDKIMPASDEKTMWVLAQNHETLFQLKDKTF
ncbi:MAG: formylmethanofuran dehydrogenase subunit E family protein [Candidatus Aenigmatarchaeota archaeon]